jgi:hypothetical protein
MAEQWSSSAVTPKSEWNLPHGLTLIPPTDLNDRSGASSVCSMTGSMVEDVDNLLRTQPQSRSETPTRLETPPRPEKTFKIVSYNEIVLGETCILLAAIATLHNDKERDKIIDGWDEKHFIRKAFFHLMRFFVKWDAPRGLGKDAQDYNEFKDIILYKYNYVQNQNQRLEENIKNLLLKKQHGEREKGLKIFFQLIFV